jgi:hypothetical protein
LTQATEQLNIEEDVDKFKDAASIMQEQTNALNSPLLSLEGSTMADEFVVDEEVARLLQEQDDADAVRMPDLPDAVPVKENPVQQQQRTAAEIKK